MSAPATDLSQATVGQLLIPVDDLDRAVAFYKDTLGVPFLFTAPPQMSFFQCGSVRLLVGVPETQAPAQRSSAVYFQVEDIHAVHAELSRRGVAFQAPPHVIHRTPEYELSLAEFRDPFGNPLVLMSQTRPSA
jgi:methylmalonyl-CoA/ethylmalonyl-CoA epimerase